MNPITNGTYEKINVLLDGNHYIHCTFTSCRLVYMGRDKFGLTDNTISPDCVLGFAGQAVDVIGTLRDIYAMDEWGRAQVLATLQHIAPGAIKSN